MDMLNNAAKKIKDEAGKLQSGSSQPANESKPAEEDPDHPLRLEDHYEGHCHGHNTATCLDATELLTQCLEPIKGYRMKMLAQRIDYRLKNEQLPEEKRKVLEEDRDAAQEAAANHSDEPTIAGQKESQRYLSDIDPEDQVWVNAEYGRYRNRIMNKCEGADQMGTGHRTELIKDFGMTGDEAVAEYRRKHAESHPSHSDCMKGIGGLRYTIMADMMEKKMKTLELSADERAKWKADIAAVREAAKSGGTTVPKVDDPKNPYRPLTRLQAPADQMALSQEYSAQTQTALAACQSATHAAGR
ncbi:MAG: hypothetical protein GC151_19145 [Betaproteobacteria bacterium]|nr:hypothetical protein [Betaproteobacteria bacterium]